MKNVYFLSLENHSVYIFFLNLKNGFPTTVAFGLADGRTAHGPTALRLHGAHGPQAGQAGLAGQGLTGRMIWAQGG